MDGEPFQEYNLYRNYWAGSNPVPLTLSSPPAASLPVVPGKARSHAEGSSGAAWQKGNKLFTPKFLRLFSVLKMYLFTLPKLLFSSALIPLVQLSPFLMKA